MVVCAEVGSQVRKYGLHLMSNGVLERFFEQEPVWLY